MIRIALLVLVAIALAGCATNRVTGELDHNWYSEQGDIEVGREALFEMLSAFGKADVRVDADTARVERLREMMHRIAAQTEYADVFPWRLHLAEIGVVNACCFPGGHIVVCRGLIMPGRGLVTNEDEMVGVLAHEIAHATCRHGTQRRSTRYTLIGALFVPYLALQLIVPGAGTLFNVVSTQGVNLYMPAYSRDAEREADHHGLVYMAKAGYDPRVMPALWRRAAARPDRGSLESLYASHPSDEERAERLDALMPEVLPLYEAARAARESTP